MPQLSPRRQTVNAVLVEGLAEQQGCGPASQPMVSGRRIGLRDMTARLRAGRRSHIRAGEIRGTRRVVACPGAAVTTAPSVFRAAG